MVNKQKPTNLILKRPEFIELQNITEPLSKLVNEYGINQVILHLGLVAQKQISAKFAFMIWSIISNGE